VEVSAALENLAPNQLAKKLGDIDQRTALISQKEAGGNAEKTGALSVGVEGKAPADSG
jgi:hypothetical protein